MNWLSETVLLKKTTLILTKDLRIHLIYFEENVRITKQVVDYAHERGIIVVIDGAQSVPHMPVDVQAMVNTTYMPLDPRALSWSSGDAAVATVNENLLPHHRTGHSQEQSDHRQTTRLELSAATRR